jgi:hypothetical protein
MSPKTGFVPFDFRTSLYNPCVSVYLKRMSNIRENKTEYVTRLAVLLFGVAFALRFYQIAGLGLWRDEIATQILVSSSLKQILHDCFTIEPNPSLYYILLHFWVRIFGDSETLLRLPSAFFGSIAVSMLFLVGRRFFSMRVGLVAALLAAFMPFQVRYGQEARAYALFGMLALASLYYMPLQLKWPTRRSPAIFAVVSCLLPLALQSPLRGTAFRRPNGLCGRRVDDCEYFEPRSEVPQAVAGIFRGADRSRASLVRQPASSLPGVSIPIWMD